MKRILLLLIVLFSFPFIINAETRLTSTVQNPLVGDNIIIRMQLDYGTDTLISECHYKITYNPNALQVDDIYFTQSPGTFIEEKGVIYVDKVAASKEEYWEYGSQLYINFKILKSGTYPVKIDETGRARYADGSFISQYMNSITINASEPSTETRINSLLVKGHDFNEVFSRNIKNYTLTVEPDVTQVEVVALKGEEHQTITGTGIRTLEYGDNRVTVNVSAQNGTTDTYTIMIHRKDDRTGDASLSSVKVGNINAIYNDQTETYKAVVSKDTESVVLTGITKDPKATLLGTGTKQLSFGENTFELTVETNNDISKKYKIIVERLSTDEVVATASTDLQTLIINETTINVTKETVKIPYGATVNDETLTINAIPESSTAKVSISNPKLKIGANTITITVTETNGDKKEYTIIAYKPAPNYTKAEDVDNLPADRALIYNSKETDTHFINNITALRSKELLYNVVNSYNAPLYIVKFNYFAANSVLDVSFTKDEVDKNQYKTSLPSGLDITLYVGDEFENDTYLKIFTNNGAGKEELLTEGVKVVDGYITFRTNGQTSYYFRANASSTNISFNYTKFILPGIIGGVIILLLLYGLTHLKKKPKQKNESSY